MNNTILFQLPKTELHCHLDGSISLGTIRQLAKMANVDLPTDDDLLKQRVTAPSETESLLDYLKCFDVIRPLLQTKEALSLAAHDVVRQAALENVIYTEIRFAPELSMDKGLSVKEIILSVLEGIQNAENEFGISARVLICGLRQSSSELSRAIFKDAIEFCKNGVVGFDFAGDEAGFPPEKIENLIKEASQLGLPLTLHAGECGCAKSISDALVLGAKRLGHVTAIYDQPELIHRMLSNKVTAELCLTSNLQTKAAKTLDEFPYQALYEAGANITINTDNRTVSDTNLTKEYTLFQKYFGTTVADFYQFNQNAIASSFTSLEHKEKLSDLLRKNYQPFVDESSFLG